MTDNVTVPFGDSMSDTANLLLAAAAELGLDASVVAVDTANGGFSAPPEVVSEAGLEAKNYDAEFEADLEAARAVADQGAEIAQAKTQAAADAEPKLDGDPVNVTGDLDPAQVEKAAAKKAVAKKAPARKAPAKKAVAKKAPAKKATARKVN